MKEMLSRLGVAVLVVLTTGCGTPSAPPQEYLARYQVGDPTPERFRVCYNFGCRGSTTVRLDTEGWARVRALFTPAAESAAAERVQVAAAVAHLEHVVGPRAGFHGDLGENDWPKRASYQLDCIDETINTTVYLLMMERDGLLRRHRVRYPEGRLWPNLLPHNTAVLVENGNGAQYAVDSWFFDNGTQPEIVPLGEWEGGYWPEAPSDPRASAAVAD